MKQKQKLGLWIAIIVIICVVLFYFWRLHAQTLPDGFAKSNGRIEATEIDIATKIAGRVESIDVKEGDFVKKGQVLAVMDRRSLEEQLNEAKAQLNQAISNVSTAQATLKQRQSEKLTADAVVRQREAEFDVAQKKLNRSKALLKTKAISQQQVDDDNANTQGTFAALEASKAQVAAALAAISAAENGIVQAQTRVDAAQATQRRIEADLEDCTLKAPRNGRIQYRVAEPGEVLAAGGRVLNMVDLNDVYMTFFLPTEEAGKVALGSEAHIVLDALPDEVIPAKITFVASVAQFTPKTVETKNERLKLMFRVRAHISPELLEAHLEYVKTGLPGEIYVRLDPNAKWPTALEVK